MNKNRLRSILSDFKNGHSDMEQTVELVVKNFTSTNTGSPKLLAYLDNAAESIHIGNISLAELNINEARKQLRASA